MKLQKYSERQYTFYWLTVGFLM